MLVKKKKYSIFMTNTKADTDTVEYAPSFVIKAM